MRLWDIAGGKQIRHFTPPDYSGVYSLVFSSDGKTLASAGISGTVRLWDPASGKEIRQFQGHQGTVFAVAFSPDGTTLASAAEDKTVRLWDVGSGKEIRQLLGHPGWVGSVRYSPDGRILVSAGDDGMVRLWEAATGKEIKNLHPHQGGVYSLAFSPDGGRLATAGSNTTVLVWRLSELFCPEPAARSPHPAPRDLWTALASDDAAKAYQAVGTLIGGGKETVAFLRQQLRPVRVSDDLQRIPRLLADLDNNEFSVREIASEELAKLGSLALPALKKALASEPPPEVRTRVEALLEKLARQPPTPESIAHPACRDSPGADRQPGSERTAGITEQGSGRSTVDRGSQSGHEAAKIVFSFQFSDKTEPVTSDMLLLTTDS